MNENRPCKKELLEWINIVSFAVDDVKGTHGLFVVQREHENLVCGSQVLGGAGG